jgi:tRNA-uridine 2-sulfurtransferase
MGIKAVALVSSGLDSLLSVKLVRDQGIEVLGLHCSFAFGASHKTDRRYALEAMLNRIDVQLTVTDITEPFMDILRHPEHGFGSAVNPCIDCHLFMLRRAKEMMEETGASFVVTGEVVGQRPMSQNRPTLFHIEKHAGLQGLILRPLSAKLLPLTLPEEKGWVHRESLHAIGGRGRKAQEALAASLGIFEYFQPAGGCILTDPIYAKRVRAFIRYRGQENLTSEAMSLFRHGRHFWIDRRLWIIAGRDEKDNAALEAFRKKRWAFAPSDEKGPLVLADGVHSRNDLDTAAGITTRYSQNRVPIVAEFENDKQVIDAQPVPEAFIQENRL